MCCRINAKKLSLSFRIQRKRPKSSYFLPKVEITRVFVTKLQRFVPSLNFFEAYAFDHRVVKMLIFVEKIVHMLGMILSSDMNKDVNVQLGILDGQELLEKFLDEGRGFLNENSNDHGGNLNEVVESQPVDVAGNASFPLVPSSTDVVSKVAHGELVLGSAQNDERPHLG